MNYRVETKQRTSALWMHLNGVLAASGSKKRRTMNPLSGFTNGHNQYMIDCAQTPTQTDISSYWTSNYQVSSCTSQHSSKLQTSRPSTTKVQQFGVTTCKQFLGITSSLHLPPALHPTYCTPLQPACTHATQDSSQFITYPDSFMSWQTQHPANTPQT